MERWCGVQAFCGASDIKNLGRSHQKIERQAMNYFSLSAQQTMSGEPRLSEKEEIQI